MGSGSYNSKFYKKNYNIILDSLLIIFVFNSEFFFIKLFN